MSTIVTRSGKGSPLTHVEVDANFTNLNTDKYQEGSAIGAVTPAAGTFTTLTSTSETLLGANGSNNQTFRATAGTGAFPWVQTSHASGDARIRASAASGNSNFSLSSLGTSAVRFYTNAFTEEQLRVSHTASAVNYVQVTGAATGAYPVITAQGSDSNITMGISSKGTNTVSFYTNNNSARQFAVTHTASPANYATATGAATGASPTFSVAGTDTNIDLIVSSKGSGSFKINNAGGTVAEFNDGGAATPVNAFLFAAGAASVLVKQQLEAVDATSKLSRTLGITTEELVGYEHAAGLAGVENEKLYAAILKINKAQGLTGTTNEIRFTSGLWLNTAAITKISIANGQYVSGSRLSLYGVRG